jgi:hypothetical protein
LSPLFFLLSSTTVVRVWATRTRAWAVAALNDVSPPVRFGWVRSTTSPALFVTWSQAW